MADEERKNNWAGRVQTDGSARMFVVDPDERPHAQTTQALAAMRRAQRPTFARLRGNPDTAPGRPPGDPPGPQEDTRIPAMGLVPSPAQSAPTQPAEGSGWGTPAPTLAPEPPEGTTVIPPRNPWNNEAQPEPELSPGSNDDLITISRSELETIIHHAVNQRLDPIAQAISDMRAAFGRKDAQGGSPLAEQVPDVKPSLQPWSPLASVPAEDESGVITVPPPDGVTPSEVLATLGVDDSPIVPLALPEPDGFEGDPVVPLALSEPDWTKGGGSFASAPPPG